MFPSHLFLGHPIYSFLHLHTNCGILPSFINTVMGKKKEQPEDITRTGLEIGIHLEGGSESDGYPLSEEVYEKNDLCHLMTKY